MVVKDVYQSGINILIDGFKALMEVGNTSAIPNYGAKSNVMFDHCQITLLVSDVRGVELIALKKLANTVKVLNVNPFIGPKKLRPTIFSSEYPSVNTTEEFRVFSDTTSQVVQKTITLMNELPKEILDIPAVYKYNFAGSISFDVLITFTGSNLSQILGVFPGQGLKDKDGSWLDPNGQYFINKVVSAFKNVYYDALEGIFGTIDMETDVALEKLYFTKLRNRDMSTINVESGKLTNILYAQVIHPMGSMDLISENRPKNTAEYAELKEKICQRMNYADSVIYGTQNGSCFGTKSDFLMDNATFIIYAQCSIQTLLMLNAYTNIVSYHTDMKNVLGVTTTPAPLITLDGNHIKVDGKSYSVDNAAADTLVENVNGIVVELVNMIEFEKTSILRILKNYQKSRDFYEENRYNNTKLRPPKSMIQRKEYYNMVPLYAQTCCVIKFTEKDVDDIRIDKIPNNIELRSIVSGMQTLVATARNYVSSYDR